MIKRIEIENFFSFGKAQPILLNPGQNIMVGINGSGKSNFLKAIYLLSESMREGGSLQRVISAWGGFDSVCNFSQDRKDTIRLAIEFDKEKVKQVLDDKGYLFLTNPIYEIEIHRVGSTDYYLTERLYNKSVKDGQQPFIYLQMENGRGFLSERDEKTGKSNLKHRTHFEKPEETFNGRELVLKQVTDPKQYFPLFTLKKVIESFAVYSYFDTSPNSEIRKYQDYTVDEKLTTNGNNLSQVLQFIAKTYTLDFEKIEETLRKVNPTYKTIRLDNQNGRLGVLLVESNLARTVSIESVSDGTFRFLLLLAIFFNPKRGGVICIDEPETGLHPDMLLTMSNMIRHGYKTGSQIIMTTHSPLLLNTFELDDLWIFEKDSRNQTRVDSKDEEDFEGWVNEFLPGDLWLRGLISGRRTA